MDTTTQHPVAAPVHWIGKIRAAAIGAIAPAAIVASMIAWTVILNHALSAHP